MLLKRILRKFFDNIVFYEGSTRPLALIRIGIVFILWSSWAYDFRLEITLNISPMATLLGISFFVSTFLMLMGYRSRLAAIGTGLTLFIMYFYLGKTLGQTRYVMGYGHHQYLLVVATCLLALTPCGGSYSLDRWLAIQKAQRLNLPTPPETGSLWATRLIAWQISQVYFWSAYHKSSSAFLSGERLEHLFMNFYFGSDYPAIPFFHQSMMVLAAATVFLEYFLSVGLWIPQFRNLCLFSAFAFHALIYYLFPVKAYSVTMFLLLIIFLPPEMIHRAINRLSGCQA